MSIGHSEHLVDTMGVHWTQWVFTGHIGHSLDTMDMVNNENVGATFGDIEGSFIISDKTPVTRFELI